jgi:hypothetical protein
VGPGPWLVAAAKRRSRIAPQKAAQAIQTVTDTSPQPASKTRSAIPSGVMTRTTVVALRRN